MNEYETRNTGTLRYTSPNFKQLLHDGNQYELINNNIEMLVYSAKQYESLSKDQKEEYIGLERRALYVDNIVNQTFKSTSIEDSVKYFNLIDAEIEDKIISTKEYEQSKLIGLM